MEAKLHEALSESLIEVLETLAYESPAACDPHASTDWLRADLEFSGGVQGEFSLSIESGEARSLAAALLGQMPGDLTDDDALAAVGEIANMVCGGCVSRVAPNALVQLAAPRAQRSSESETRDALWLEGEAGHLSAHIEMSRPS
ncbi:MAG TPA: chemotaxis protein CheX [Polyangiaceae bacterium]|nr:chemotaxis protein CheX [Polyangiaceae bacterium]